jgi:hypothetical protein
VGGCIIKATERKETKMTMDELMEYVLRELPDAIFSEDSTGEIVISTGLQGSSDELKPIVD